MWIARDADGSLWLFEEKPYKGRYVWYNGSTNYRTNKKLFPEVKWSDEEPRELVLKPTEDSHKFFQNKGCKYFPCHSNISERDFNCMFCYCPLYNKKECGGNYRILENGVKDCSDCVTPHGKNSWDIIYKKLK